MSPHVLFIKVMSQQALDRLILSKKYKLSGGCACSQARVQVTLTGQSTELYPGAGQWPERALALWRFVIFINHLWPESEKLRIWEEGREYEKIKSTFISAVWHPPYTTAFAGALMVHTYTYIYRHVSLVVVVWGRGRGRVVFAGTSDGVYIVPATFISLLLCVRFHLYVRQIFWKVGASQYLNSPTPRCTCTDRSDSTRKSPSLSHHVRPYARPKIRKYLCQQERKTQAMSQLEVRTVVFVVVVWVADLYCCSYVRARVRTRRGKRSHFARAFHESLNYWIGAVLVGWHQDKSYAGACMHAGSQSLCCTLLVQAVKYSQ